MTSSVGAKPASEPEHGASRSEKKVAIVTGASQGIGAGIAAAFSSTGYAVVGTALSVEPSVTPNVLMIPGDIAQAETAELVVKQGLDRFGRIDTLINNAGIYIGKPFTDYTVDDYVAITSVNLTGFFHMTQRAIAQMVAQGGGHVVNVSTSLVEHADAREPSALASLTKGGLEAVTRSLATEYAGRGVRVNAVALGIIETPLHDPASYRELAKRHPLGTRGRGQRRSRRRSLPRTRHVRHRCDPPYRWGPGSRRLTKPVDSQHRPTEVRDWTSGARPPYGHLVFGGAVLGGWPRRPELARILASKTWWSYMPNGVPGVPRFLTQPKQHQCEIRCSNRHPDGSLIEAGQAGGPRGDGSFLLQSPPNSRTPHSSMRRRLHALRSRSPRNRRAPSPIDSLTKQWTVSEPARSARWSEAQSNRH